MEMWSIPAMREPNGYDLNSIKTKIPMSEKLNLYDISKAVFHRIPICKDEDTKAGLKSHVITQLPEYMALTIEELRYMNRLKNKNQNLTELSHPIYCELTKNSKLEINKNLSDTYTSCSFEYADRQKYQDWYKRVSMTNKDDTFNGMINQAGFIGGNVSTSGKYNGFGTNTQGNIQPNILSFFKPENSLNTMNNTNQFNNIQNSTNFSNNFGNQVNPSTTKYNFQQSSNLPSYNGNFSNYQAVNRDYDLFNENTNIANNNSTSRYGFSQQHGLNNNQNNSIQQFNTMHTNNTNLAVSNSQSLCNNFMNLPSQTIGIQPSGNFNSNNNSQFQFNPQNLNDQSQFAHYGQNTNNLNPYNNNTYGTGNCYQTNNLYNLPIQTNFRNNLQSGQNFTNNNYQGNNSQITQKEMNNILDNSMQNFSQHDLVIDYLNDGKRENIYSKMNNDYLKTEFLKTPDFKNKRESGVVDFNQYKPSIYFIPSEITNPKDRKALENHYEGRKNEKPYSRNYVTPTIPRRNETYHSYMVKNPERQKIKEKIDNANNNYNLFENKRNNQFLNPVLKTLPINHENRINIVKKEEAKIDSKLAISDNFYKVITQFDAPRQISFTYKTANILSIAKLKAKLINFLTSLQDFTQINLIPNDIGFIIDRAFESRDVGVYDLDKLNSVQTDNTPISNLSTSILVDKKEKKELKVLHIKAMFTHGILNLYKENIGKYQRNENNEVKNILNNSQPQQPKFVANKDFFPILTKDYVLSPNMESLKKMSKAQLEKLENFIVTSPSHGRIIFQKSVDITYINLDAIIFENNYFELDITERTTYNKLNKEANVLLYNFKIDQENSEKELITGLNKIPEFCRTLKVSFEINLNLGRIFKL